MGAAQSTLTNFQIRSVAPESKLNLGNATIWLASAAARSLRPANDAFNRQHDLQRNGDFLRGKIAIRKMARLAAKMKKKPDTNR
jgi:hypothetical protein